MANFQGNPNTLLSTGDAAAETGIDQQEIANAMSAGELPYQRFTYSGWRWVKRSDLYAWIEAKR